MSLMFHPSVTSLSQLSLLSQSQCHLCFTPVSLHCHSYLYCHSHNVTYVSPQCHFIVTIISTVTVTMSLMFHPSVTSLSQLSLLSQSQCHLCFTPASLHCLTNIYLSVIVFPTVPSKSLLYNPSVTFLLPRCHYCHNYLYCHSVTLCFTSVSFHCHTCILCLCCLTTRHKKLYFNVGLHVNLITLPHLSYFPTNKFKATQLYKM